MGSPKCGSVLYKTSKFNMMKLVLVLFVTIMVISRVASNPVNQPREPRAFSGQIIGDIGNLCQGGESGSCNGEQVGTIGGGAIKPSSIDQVGNLCQGGESGTCTGAQNGQHHGKKRRSVPLPQPRKPRANAFANQKIGNVGNSCQGGASGTCNGEQVGTIGNGAIKPSTIGQVGNLCQGGASGSCTGAQNGQHHVTADL